MKNSVILSDRSKAVLCVILIASASLITGCNSSGSIKEGATLKKNASTITNEVSVKNSVSPDSVQGLLKGKWLRTDGDYMIEIFSVLEAGRLNAAYFNPGPINVGKSTWKISEGIIIVEVELQDVNYPGSKYTLVYNKKNDCLEGNYFQAVQRINYDVVLVRSK
jgi:hypothetical protein